MDITAAASIVTLATLCLVAGYVIGRSGRGLRFYRSPRPTERELILHLGAKLQMLERKMTGQFDSLAGLVTALNDTTNSLATTLEAGVVEVGNDLQALRDQLANATGGLTATEAAELAARLGAAKDNLTGTMQPIADRLTVIGQDPTEPIPPEPEPEA